MDVHATAVGGPVGIHAAGCSVFVAAVAAACTKAGEDCRPANSGKHSYSGALHEAAVAKLAHLGKTCDVRSFEMTVLAWHPLLLAVTAEVLLLHCFSVASGETDLLSANLLEGAAQVVERAAAEEVSVVVAAAAAVVLKRPEAPLQRHRGVRTRNPKWRTYPSTCPTAPGTDDIPCHHLPHVAQLLLPCPDWRLG